MATFVCHACGSLAKIYASRPLSETAREMFLACTNERCQHTFRSIYDVLNTILPSALPDDDPERLPPGTSPVMKIRTTKRDRERNEKACERRQHAIERRHQAEPEQKAFTARESAAGQNRPQDTFSRCEMTTKPPCA